MTPQQQADQIILRAERRLATHMHEDRRLAVDIAYDTVILILAVNPYSNPLNSDGNSTWEYWNEVLEIVKQQQ